MVSEANDSPLNGPVVELVDTAVFKTEALQGMRVRNPPGPPNTGDYNMASSPMKILRDRIAAAEEDIRRKQAELDVLQSILAEMSGKPAPKQPETVKSPKVNVKKVVIDLLNDAGTSGLNATIAVEMAKAKGIQMERGSVSSTLSRMKAENIITHDGEKYRLPEFDILMNGKNIHPHPASKVFG